MVQIDEVLMDFDKGLAYRIRALRYSVQNHITDDQVIRLIRSLRNSTAFIYGYTEGEIAQAADYILTGSAATANKDKISELVERAFL